MKKLIFLLSILLVFASCHQDKKSPIRRIKVRAEQTVREQINSSDSQIVDEHDTMPKYNGQKYNTKLSDYDYTAPYICPNHCPGSGSDKPGKCPVCGMDLIPNPDYQKK